MPNKGINYITLPVYREVVKQVPAIVQKAMEEGTITAGSLVWIEDTGETDSISSDILSLAKAGDFIECSEYDELALVVEKDNSRINLQYITTSGLYFEEYRYNGTSNKWEYYGTSDVIGSYLGAADLSLSKIKDSAGNQRFVEGEIKTTPITGVTYTYAKWSLSGTHLMVVLAGSCETDAVLSAGVAIGYTDNLPRWIADKIYPVWGTNIEANEYSLRASDWTSQKMTVAFQKASNQLYLQNISAVTLTAHRNFRLQFDLLIDSDYE